MASSLVEHFCLTRRARSISRFRTSISRFLTSDDGPTAVAYVVMLALIPVACIGIIMTLGTSISSTFSTVNKSISIILITNVEIHNS